VESIYLRMPYKDPEGKRQWEQKHRQERSQRRKAQRAKISPTISPQSGSACRAQPETGKPPWLGYFSLVGRNCSWPACSVSWIRVGTNKNV